MNFEEELEAMQRELCKLHKKERKLKDDQEKLVAENIGAKHCPFCTKGAIDVDYDWWREDPGWTVYCNCCSTHTPSCSTVAEALEHWNAMVSVRQRHRRVE